jgi:GT2 family glycosyltransferase
VAEVDMQTGREAARFDIIIPHYNGAEMLARCLNSLRQEGTPGKHIIVVDNGSSDNSCLMVESTFPEVTLVRSKENLGYAGGCNLGFGRGRAEYVFFYNNDTEISPGALAKMEACFARHSDVAAVQPKLLSMRFAGHFDYAGAAGGFLDRLAFPWCRGRMLNVIEEDKGQYNAPREVFWTSGAALMLRRQLLDKYGLFDLQFFAHMEEIDLNWRMLNAGYRNYVEPGAVVYHYSGYTLGQGNALKYFYNHRNNLLMLVKNAPVATLLWLYPLRLLLDVMMMIKALLSREWAWAGGICRALPGHLRLIPHVLRERRRLISLGAQPTLPGYLMLPVSIIYYFFVLKRRKFSDIVE